MDDEKIRKIAKEYSVDPAELDAWLETILEYYQHDEVEYKQVRDKRDYIDQYSKIEKAASRLIDTLTDADEAVLHTLPKQPSISRLSMMRDRAAHPTVSIENRKPEFHRNNLALALGYAWIDLTGKKPNQSTNRNSFHEFMMDTTKCMGIKPRGLWRKFKERVYPIFNIIENS